MEKLLLPSANNAKANLRANIHLGNFTASIIKVAAGGKRIAISN
jgi:hypothetical protein